MEKLMLKNSEIFWEEVVSFHLIRLKKSLNKLIKMEVER